MTWLEGVRVSVSVASKTDDPTLRVAYVAAARDMLERWRSEFRDAEASVVAQEQELARIGGAK